MKEAKVLTVKDVIEKLKRLPPDMEVWNTWDESGESFPITEKAFEKSEYSDGWLNPEVVIRRRTVTKKLIYEIANPKVDAARIKRAKRKKFVVVI